MESSQTRYTEYLIFIYSNIKEKGFIFIGGWNKERVDILYNPNKFTRFFFSTCRVTQPLEIWDCKSFIFNILVWNIKYDMMYSLVKHKST